MRRSRTIYYAVIGVIIIVIGAVVAVVWSHGEVAHASLHSVASAPPNLALSEPSPQQTRAWSTTDRTALGVPVLDGTVITYSEHTVSGRNARTGARTWTYTRTDRPVCNVVQLVNITIAVFDRDGNCDEVDAFDSRTGARAWDRTLDENGQPLNGRPSFSYSGGTLMITSPSVIYAIDSQGGGDVWTYSRYGCRIEHAVAGEAGALISQDCTSVQCKGIAKCGKGQQLFLRNMIASSDTCKKNCDNIIWNDIGNTGVPASADAIVSAVQPGSNVLDRLDVDNGKTLRAVELDPAPKTLDDIAATETDAAELIWIDGRLNAVTPNGKTPLWDVAADAAPTVLDSDVDDPPVLSLSRVTVPSSAGITALAPQTGRVESSFDVGPLPANSRVTPMGTGFLVSSTDGTVAYR